MTDPYAAAIMLAAIVITAGLMFAGSAADAVRDADWWVVLRGRISARRDRFRRRRELRR